MGRVIAAVVVAVAVLLLVFGSVSAGAGLRRTEERGVARPVAAVITPAQWVESFGTPTPRPTPNSDCSNVPGGCGTPFWIPTATPSLGGPPVVPITTGHGITVPVAVIHPVDPVTTSLVMSSGSVWWGCSMIYALPEVFGCVWGSGMSKMSESYSPYRYPLPMASQSPLLASYGPFGYGVKIIVPGGPAAGAESSTGLWVTVNPTLTVASGGYLTMTLRVVSTDISMVGLNWNRGRVEIASGGFTVYGLWVFDGWSCGSTQCERVLSYHNTGVNPVVIDEVFFRYNGVGQGSDTSMYYSLRFDGVLFDECGYVGGDVGLSPTDALTMTWDDQGRIVYGYKSPEWMQDDFEELHYLNLSGTVRFLGSDSSAGYWGYWVNGIRGVLPYPVGMYETSGDYDVQVPLGDADWMFCKPGGVGSGAYAWSGVPTVTLEITDTGIITNVFTVVPTDSIPISYTIEPGPCLQFGPIQTSGAADAVVHIDWAGFATCVDFVKLHRLEVWTFDFLPFVVLLVNAFAVFLTIQFIRRR